MWKLSEFLSVMVNFCDINYHVHCNAMTQTSNTKILTFFRCKIKRMDRIVLSLHFNVPTLSASKLNASEIRLGL